MTRGAYYNEFDPYAAQWLRNLIAAGHIAPGDVDERSIVDVRPDDLKGYTQVHFFAGIGGWSLAARLAGWPDDRPLWTGSCPCQPFSAAGKRKGTADERHLWPVFAALIAECRPAVVAGEQVASKDGLGWLDGVWADLETARYAVWAADYCAAGVGAPHIRQRLWWLGHSNSAGRSPREFEPQRAATRPEQSAGSSPSSSGSGLADANGGHASTERQQPGRQHGLEPEDRGAGARVGYASGDGREQRRPEPSGRCAVGRCGEGDGLADTERYAAEPGRFADQPREGDAASGTGPHAQPGRRGVPSFWSDYELVPCRDGTARRTQPGIFPLAHGVSGRVGKLRAAGNAIVPQVAAEILRAYLDGPGRERVRLTEVSGLKEDVFA